jgi:Spy/CpxP family protein refolding chaperone
MRIATVLSAVLLIAGAVFAQQGPAAGGPHRGMVQTDLIKAFLNLSDQQLQDLTGVETTFREAARPLMHQMREKAQTMRQTLQQDPKADISQLQADLASLRTQIKDLQTQYQAQAERVLTEEQKANLATLQKALELMPTVHQAMGLNLLERPEGFPEGFGGPRFFRGRGPGAPPKQ